MDAPAPVKVDLAEARPRPAGELSDAERAERDRQHTEALAAARQLENAPVTYAPAPAEGEAVLIHFIEDGLTAFGAVWYRGQEMMGPGHPRWDRARGWVLLDRTGRLTAGASSTSPPGLAWPQVLPGRRGRLREAGRREGRGRQPRHLRRPGGGGAAAGRRGGAPPRPGGPGAAEVTRGDAARRGAGSTSGRLQQLPAQSSCDLSGMKGDFPRRAASPDLACLARRYRRIRECGGGTWKPPAAGDDN